jgi:probable F420-dependent oxidoreductase
MQFYQSLQFVDTGRIVELAQFIETQTPFDGVFLGDHTLYPDRASIHYPYTSNNKVPWSPETHWPDIGAAMGAMATATTRIHMTTSIIILPLRHPIDMAKMMATLSVLSNNRCSLGIGVGWMEDEFLMQGLDFKARGKRCDEMLEVMRLLWTGESVKYKGKHFDIPPSVLSPPAKVPLYIGGDAPPAMRRAARYGDGWLTSGGDFDTMFKSIDTMRGLLKEAGREGEPFEYVASLRDDLDRIKRLRDIGCTRIHSLPTYDEIEARATVQQQKDYYRRYADDIIAKL